MPTHHETCVLPYSAEEMFSLVKDVARYPEFLPWCKAARITKQNGHNFEAELVVAFKGFRESYVSHVSPERLDDGSFVIEVALVRGPFKHLQNQWHFQPNKTGGCNIAFDIDFSFKASMFNHLITSFFTRATEKMVAAFSARADALHRD